jgi:tetratricopeptide (TPR) repeat protein
VVERFGGHVAQYLGDGLLVYFGYPAAHEDDAEGAVRAGLGIVDAIEENNPQLEQKHGLRLAGRTGIHTGPVVVGEMGGGASRETLAMGDTTNVAARLQGIADPDAVVMSGATLRLVSGIFVTRDLGEQRLKGLAEPVHALQAMRPSGVRSRLDVAAATGLTPFVGREQEIMLLGDRWAQVQENWGQAVLISGEAGIGKSRLMQAFREQLVEQAHTWLECRGSPSTQDSAFYPVLELQRLGLGFRPEDAPEAKLERIEAGLEAVAFDLEENVPLVAALHGVPLAHNDEEPVLSPEGRRKKTIELLAEWLLRLGESQPLVLLIEDLHRMDPSTVELMGQVLDRIASAQVLVLLTYRPDFEPPWGARSHVTPMLLSRLTRAQLGDLVRKAARGRDLPDPWVEEILRRADGVPLFAEELTRTVLETNPEPPEGDAVPELHIPDTLQDSLMARLDALGPVKELAQLGAVLGREFSYDLLLEVSPIREAELQQALAAAVREELFYQRGTPPDAAYLFKHALIRDAAYQSLLRATRQRHHLRVAETLIDRMPEVAEEQPELVAHHLTEADDADRAIAYWQRAGERANTRAENEEAIQHLRHGIGLIEHLSEGPERKRRELPLQVALARALVAGRGYAHDETMQAWARARDLCDQTLEPVRAGVIHHGLGSLFGSRGEFARGLEEYTQELRIGEANQEPLIVISGHQARGVALFFLGRFSESCQSSQAAIDAYDPARHRFLEAGWFEDVGTLAFCYGGLAFWHAGFPERAWSAARRSLEVARTTRDPYGLAYAFAWGGVLAGTRRDWASARDLGATAVQIGAEQGFPLIGAIGGFAEAWGAALADGDPEALDRYLDAMSDAAAAGNRGGVPWILGILSEIQLATSRLEEAAATVDAALSVAQETSQPFRDAELHRQKGEIFLAREGHSEEEAEREFVCALDIARSQEAKSLELRAATSLARLWQRQGKRAEARDLLAPVYDWFSEGFDTPDLVDAKALLEELRA